MNYKKQLMAINAPHLRSAVVAILLAFCLVRCTPLHNPQTDILWDRYQSLANSLSRSPATLEMFKLYYTEQQYNELSRNKSNALLVKTALTALKLPTWFANVQDHHEYIRGLKGCLIVSGQTDTKEPLQATIEYRIQEDRWQIHYVNLKWKQDALVSKESKCSNDKWDH